MTLLEIPAPWWTLAGLSADIIGVLILAVDIIPEYNLYQARKWIEYSRSAARNVRYGETPERRVTVFGADVDIDKNEAAVLLDNLIIAARTTEDAEVLKTATAISGLPFSHLAFDVTVNAIVHALNKRTTSLGERRRPPIHLGMLLMVAGFILQFIGTIMPLL